MYKNKIITKIIFIILSLMLILPKFTSVKAEELNSVQSVGDLVNNGFESGDLASWNILNKTDSIDVISADNYTFPYSGNYMMRLGTAALSKDVKQTIGENSVYQDFIAQSQNLTFHYNVFTFDYTGFDEFQYKLERLDTGEVVADFTQGGWGPSGDTTLKNTGWQTVSLDLSKQLGKPLRLTFNGAGTKDTLYPMWAYIDMDQTDNLAGSILINQPSANMNITEGGPPISYQLSLSKQPTNDVVIDLSEDANTQVSIQPKHVVFTKDNWNQPITVQVSAIDDNVYEGNHFAKINHSATSNDANYKNSTKSLTINIGDNDTQNSGYFSITSTVSTGKGTVEPAAQNIKLGDSASINLSPEEGYFPQVMDNGLNVSNLIINNKYYIENVNQHHNVVVSYIPITPPKIIKTVPLNNESNVGVDQTVSIMFNDNITASTAFNNVYLKDSSGNNVAITKKITNNILEIGHVEPLKAATNYTLTLPKDSIQDSYKIGLQSEYSLMFTTDKSSDSENIIQNIMFKPASITMGTGETEQFMLIAEMSDGTTKDVTNLATYTKSSAFVTVTGTEGIFKLAGTTPVDQKIMVTANYDGKTATSEITVVDTTPKPVSIAYGPSSVTMGPGETKTFKLMAEMSDGTTKDVTSLATYTKSSAFVTVTGADGTFKLTSTTPIGQKITVTSNYAGKTATNEITVVDTTPKPVSIAYGPSSVTMGPGETKTFKLMAEMSDGTTKDVTSLVTYTKSSAFVTVTGADGTFKLTSTTPIGQKITVTANYAGKTATNEITVVDTTPKPVSIAYDPSSVTMGPGETKTFKLMAEMSDGTTKDVTSLATYTKSSGFVTVTGVDGTIKLSNATPVGQKITITANYGGKTGTIEIMVE
ncbi:Ig-like domain-containing protein [Fictibacillus sp. FJAT-27399]|uniref:Ig-like domain-containing protein n=1 Tax=Fictibacillus sp. FJAT-27399 TaxID=1729689 RepID=UPI0007827CB1|nr:Ig-like domain-containing protein [Fictibacillus sp. FJAT-27399]